MPPTLRIVLSGLLSFCFAATASLGCVAAFQNDYARAAAAFSLSTLIHLFHMELRHS
jgi:hypothetical protein